MGFTKQTACRCGLHTPVWALLPHRKNLNRLFERPISPGIIWGQLRAPINPQNTILLWWSEGIRGSLNWGSIVQRDASLSDSYKFDRCCFSRLEWRDKFCLFAIQFRIFFWKLVNMYESHIYCLFLSANLKVNLIWKSESNWCRDSPFSLRSGRVGEWIELWFY